LTRTAILQATCILHLFTSALSFGLMNKSEERGIRCGRAWCVARE
jgi:hypothetical protein